MPRQFRSKFILFAALVALAVPFAAQAQVPIMPPPPPPQNTPASSTGAVSLGVTMKFIQDKLNDLGKVSFYGYKKGNSAGSHLNNQFSYEVSNVLAEAATCRVSYHSKQTHNGVVQSDNDFWFSLRDVQDIAVMTGEEYLTKFNAEAGHTSWDSKTDPVVYILSIKRKAKPDVLFYFTDEEMAGRVAKALVHGVDLCSGASKDPF